MDCCWTFAAWKKYLKSRPVIIIISGCSPGLLSAQTWRLRGHLLVICEPPLQKLKVNFHLFAGSVGKNLASKPNVYVSSSAGARWREVSMVERSRRHSSWIKPTDVFKFLLSAAKSFKYFNVKKSPVLLNKMFMCPSCPVFGRTAFLHLGGPWWHLSGYRTRGLHHTSEVSVRGNLCGFSCDHSDCKSHVGSSFLESFQVKSPNNWS